MQSSTCQTIQSARRHDDDLEPSPIRPEWVRAGSPQARVRKFASSADGLTGSYVWSCTAGAFDWTFDGDEIIHVVEGSVTVTSPEGVTSTLLPGDSCLFPAGTTWFWEVDEYVRKHAVIVTPLPTPVRGTLTLARRAKHALLRARTAAAVVDAPAAVPAPVRPHAAQPSVRTAFAAPRRRVGV